MLDRDSGSRPVRSVVALPGAEDRPEPSRDCRSHSRLDEIQGGFTERWDRPSVRAGERSHLGRARGRGACGDRGHHRKCDDSQPAGHLGRILEWHAVRHQWIEYGSVLQPCSTVRHPNFPTLERDHSKPFGSLLWLGTAVNPYGRNPSTDSDLAEGESVREHRIVGLPGPVLRWGNTPWSSSGAAGTFTMRSRYPTC